MNSFASFQTSVQPTNNQLATFVLIKNILGTLSTPRLLELAPLSKKCLVLQ
jgi:hypothetical protein